jgi:hypothetical protein
MNQAPDQPTAADRPRPGWLDVVFIVFVLTLANWRLLNGRWLVGIALILIALAFSIGRRLPGALAWQIERLSRRAWLALGYLLSFASWLSLSLTVDQFAQVFASIGPIPVATEFVLDYAKFGCAVPIICAGFWLLWGDQQSATRVGTRMSWGSVAVYFVAVATMYLPILSMA